MDQIQTPNKPTGIVEKAKSLGKAVKSIFDEGFATPELQRARLDVCLKTGGAYCDTCSKWKDNETNSCECDTPNFVDGPCPLLVNNKNGQHCSQCGCNQSLRATDVRMKAIAPKVDCPRSLWPTEE